MIAGCVNWRTAGGIVGPSLEADRILAHQAREPEVHDAYGAVLGDHHILGLEVSVDDSGRMSGGQPTAGGQEDIHDLAPPARLGAQPGVQCLAVDELHGYVDVLADDAGIVDSDHVRMGEPGDSARLAEQPRAALPGDADVIRRFSRRGEAHRIQDDFEGDPAV